MLSLTLLPVALALAPNHELDAAWHELYLEQRFKKDDNADIDDNGHENNGNDIDGGCVG